jgi:hypothetical protein
VKSGPAIFYHGADQQMQVSRNNRKLHSDDLVSHKGTVLIDDVVLADLIAEKA